MVKHPSQSTFRTCWMLRCNNHVKPSPKRSVCYELMVNLPIVYGWFELNFITTGKPYQIFFWSHGWSILARWFLPVFFFRIVIVAFNESTRPKTERCAAQDASVSCGVGCCERGWFWRDTMKRMNDKPLLAMLIHQISIWNVSLFRRLFWYS